ncbi:hypothetical protein [Paenibacillus sp. DMB5]|uniref:hypothetical protein n=1 Tax=Paenibacillus sp. DMB5 TaxID=1780103 RepID=UPI00076C07A8|nr:hypothetical protein [Paenibacillus sp. DMB5]KUP25488.1 hypothetical protein AWJ19_18890 [Paenibacillus sp. DMB5]
MKGSRKNRHNQSKRRLYYVDNPNKTELSMLRSGPRVQGDTSTGETDTVADTPDQTLVVSGVGTAELPAPAEAVTVEPAPQLQPETQQQPASQAPSLSETDVRISIPAEPLLTEKERLQKVYTDDISEAAVTGSKIAPRTIDGSKLKFGIIGTPWLQDYAVQSINIAEKAVTSSKIAHESISGEHLVEGSISGGKLLDHSIGGEKLKNGSIGPEKLADRTIGGEQIADRSISGRISVSC